MLEVQREVVGGAKNGCWRCREWLLEVQSMVVEDPASNSSSSVSVYESIIEILLGMSLQAC